MTRVGFVLRDNRGWTGGHYYLKNLLYAVSRHGSSAIEPVFLAGAKADHHRIMEILAPGAPLVRSALLDRKSVPWTIHKASAKLLNVQFFLNNLIKKENIAAVSHSDIAGNGLACKTINWIPDFQHLHLPDMFSQEEIKIRNALYLRLARCSDILILSSHDALEDLKHFAQDHVHNARVLQFVCQPDERIFGIQGGREIEKKYTFKGKFFYLPNQFWKHKNHRVVFEAVKLLKERRLNVLVLCSGLMEDYRNKGHVDGLLQYVRDNGLNENIRLLGLIDYTDVLYLMRNSISVINPSLFEGWSSTVEEAKSIGKSLILSNINVHREQNPPAAVYFDPADSEGLANILWQKWNASAGGPDADLEREAAAFLPRRTMGFAKTYENIVYEVLNKNGGNK